MGKRKVKKHSKPVKELLDEEPSPAPQTAEDDPATSGTLTLTIPPRFRARAAERSKDITPPPLVPEEVAKAVRKGVTQLLGQRRSLRNRSKNAPKPEPNTLLEDLDKLAAREMKRYEREQRAKESGADSPEELDSDSGIEVDELESDGNNPNEDSSNGVTGAGPDPSSEGGSDRESDSEEEDIDELEPSSPLKPEPTPPPGMAALANWRLFADRLTLAKKRRHTVAAPVKGSKKATAKAAGKVKEDREPSPVPITELVLLVPHDGASSKVSVPVGISWGELEGRLANIWSIAPKQVKVAYRFSTSTRTTAYEHLPDQDALNTLVKAARKAIVTLEHSRRQENTRNDFYVEIKDLRDNSKQRQAKNKKKSGSKKGVSGKAKKRARSSDSSQAASAASSESDDDSDTIDPEKIRKKKRSSAQWQDKIKKDNFCKEHNGPCYKPVGGEHHQYQRDEIGLWSMMLMNGYASTTNPPSALKIADATVTSRRGNPKTPARPDIQLQGQAPAFPPGMPYPPFPYPPMTTPYPYYPPPPPWASPAVPTGSHGASSRRSHRDGSMANPMSSSPPEAHIEDVTIFPRLEDWLKELDEGPRGRDNRNFAQYTQRFIDEEFFRVCDIADLSEDGMMATCPGMTMGTAHKLLKYAKEDTLSIRKKQQKNSRRM